MFSAIAFNFLFVLFFKFLFVPSCGELIAVHHDSPDFTAALKTLAQTKISLSPYRQNPCLMMVKHVIR